MDELIEANMNLMDAIIDFVEAYQDAAEELESCDDEILVELMTDLYNKLTQ